MNSIVSAIAAVICCTLLNVQCMPQTSSRPSYIDCATSDECMFDSCCVLGMERYSIPRCEKKLQLHEECRPTSDMPFNSTVSYPDGQLVSLYNVHMIMCPCAAGLTCDKKTRVCVDFDGVSSYNDLYDQQVVQVD